MEINGPHTQVATRLFETLLRSKGFKCCACETIYVTSDSNGKPDHDKLHRLCAYVAAYKPRDPFMKKLFPAQNAAAYVVCTECSRMDEKTVFAKVEAHMTQNAGLLQTGHKPLDEPGSHRKKNPIITQGSRFKFDEDQ